VDRSCTRAAGSTRGTGQAEARYLVMDEGNVVRAIRGEEVGTLICRQPGDGEDHKLAEDAEGDVGLGERTAKLARHGEDYGAEQ